MPRLKPIEVDPIMHVFKGVFAQSVGSTMDEVDRDLSQRQLAVLLIVGLEDQVEHRVGDLAKRLRISKVAVTRALQRLEEFGMVRRFDDPTDRRSMLIVRTSTGAAHLRQMSKWAKYALKQH